MGDNKDAIGGNYKLDKVRVYSSIESFYQNEKMYRLVLDESECRFIYGELSFYNKLFDERDWECQAKLVCTNVTKNELVHEITKDLKVTKDQNTAKVSAGWGTPNPGWWKKGKYKWDAYLNGEHLGTSYYYIVNEGLVTVAKNPYFSINSIRMYERPSEVVPIEKRKYLKVFNKTTTRYVAIEVNIDILSTDKNLPLDFKFVFYNSTGHKKGLTESFLETQGPSKNFIFTSSYGTPTAGSFWYEDDYIMEVLFMNVLVATVPFKVAQEEEVLEDASMSFNVTTREETRSLIQEEKTAKLTYEEATAELNSLIGLDLVKKQIDELSTYLKFLKIRQEKGFKEDNKFNLNTVFLGNPGTGKTTVAKMLGKIYQSLDLLTDGHVHEVGRVDLVGEYIGQTAPKVLKAIEKARGGILFVDEAYSLSNRGGSTQDFGKEVIEVLLKEMSDGPGNIAIIFAGYPEEMQSFLTFNSGMSSRISSTIHFPDYVPDELMEIADYTAQKRDVKIDDESRALLYKKVVEAYRGRDSHFGNARFVNGIIEECKQNMALRLMKTPDFEKLESDALSTITLEDVEKAFGVSNSKKVLIPVDEAALAEALKELKEMIGMEEVKKDVDEMAKLVRYYTEIGRDARKVFSMHTVFTGNPGTGKTTVARILVKIYKALGILERGQLIECDREELVAGYVGQTAIKTAQMIDRAMGGGLFIDEAYSLTQGGQGDFGREAVDTLLKRMEDQRGEFIVIVAGYPNEMRKFLEMNPGLMSRFDRTIKFEDYTASELMEIAKMMFDKENLYLDTDSEAHLLQYIEQMLENKHQYFGNARAVRKIVQEITRRQNLRLANFPADQRTSEMVKEVLIADFDSFKLIEQDENKPRKGIGFA